MNRKYLPYIKLVIPNIYCNYKGAYQNMFSFEIYTQKN